MTQVTVNMASYGSYANAVIAAFCDSFGHCTLVVTNVLIPVSVIWRLTSVSNINLEKFNYTT